MSTAAKTCIRCFRVLPIGSFYTHAGMRDGHLNVCKACVKLRVRLRSRRKHAEIAAYDRLRAVDPGRKRRQTQNQRDHRERNPDKYRARNAVSNAIRDGRIQRRPCSGCGTTRAVQAHHEDYSRPLDVRWLCFKCHREGEHGQHTS